MSQAGKADDDYLGTVWLDELGAHGVDNDPNHLLLRAAHAILLKGRPQKAVCFCMYRALNVEPALRWFGIFIRTAGDRILFVPSIEIEVATKRKKLRVDHITLTKTRRKWHYTSPLSQDHEFGGHTRVFTDGRIGWCGITFPNEQILPPVRKQIVLRGRVPQSYRERRINQFIRAARAAQHHVIGQARSLSPTPGSPHFMLTLSKTGASVKQPEKIFVPSPSYSNTVNVHPVRLDDELRIEIAVAWLKEAQMDVLFTPGSR